MTYKAYFGIKYHADNRNRGQVNAICDALAADGIQTVCIARDIEKWGDVTLSQQELMQTSFEEIDKSDLVILEMSEKGVGLGIEAGYAVAKNKPLVVLIKQGLELSTTLKGIADTIIAYSRAGDIRVLAQLKNWQDS